MKWAGLLLTITLLNTLVNSTVILSNNDENLISNIIEIELRGVKNNFDSFRLKYSKNQSEIIYDSASELKAEHDNDLKVILEQIMQVRNTISYQNEELSERKREILNNIGTVIGSTSEQLEKLMDDERRLVSDYQRDREELEGKKRRISQLMDETGSAGQLKIDLSLIYEQIALLDKDFLAKSQNIKVTLRDLKESTAILLNESHKSLVEVYEAETKENEETKALNSINDNAINEWTNSPIITALNESLRADTFMTLDERIKIETYTIGYGKTRILFPKCCRATDMPHCSDFLLDGDDLIADCNGLDEATAEIKFNGEKFSCERSTESDEKFFTFHHCSVVGEFKSAPCEVFIFDWSASIVAGGRCSAGNELRSIRYNSSDYKCSLLAVLDDGLYYYQNCKKITAEDYVVDKAKTRFFFPQAQSDHEVKICEKFTVKDGDDIVASDCREIFEGVPKTIWFNEQAYKCLTFEFDGDDDFLIYDSCELRETATERPTSYETIYIPSLSIFRGFTTKLSSARCLKYVLNRDRYSSYDCQSDVDSVYLYDGRRLHCESLEIQALFHKFGTCVENKRLFGPTTKDLSLSDYKVTSKTMFMVPRTTDDSKRLPCGPFSYKVDDFLFQTDCAETDASIRHSVTFNARVYFCRRRSTTVNFDFFRFENCSTHEDEDDSEENFRWVDFHDRMASVPENVVYGGYDRDGLDLFVIRVAGAGGIAYGKGIDGESRKNGYVTNDLRENGVHNYEVLTADRYVWCKYDPDRGVADSLPICRAMHEHYLIPGTLLSNGTCRFGYGWKAHIKESNFQTLTTGSSKCDA